MHKFTYVRSNAEIVNQFDCILTLSEGGVNHIAVSVVAPLRIKEVM